MYRLPYSAALLLASFVLSHARQTVFTSENGVHSYLSSSAEPDVCMTPQCVISAAVVLTSLDETVDPCDDFYDFACGGWMKRHELHEDQPKIDVDVEMKDDLNRKLKELLESNYENSEPPFVRMLKDFYRTCLDLENTEKDESEPLRKMLSRLGGWPVLDGKEWDESTFDWVDSLISLRKLGFNHNIMIRMNLYMIFAEGFVNTIHLDVPYPRFIKGSNLTIGLDDPKIAAYYRLMVNAAKLLGADESTAEKELLEILNFTIALENSIITQKEKEKNMLEKKISQKEYYTIKELQEEVPKIPWLKYLNGLLINKINENETVSVKNLGFLLELADLITSTEKRVIANYMMMQVVLESSEYLSKDWNNIYEEILILLQHEREEKIEKPLWKTCLSSVEKEMELALSSFFVRCCFIKENKDEAMIIMKYIHKELLKMLEENDWMDEKTRVKAEEKANAMKFYMGYPDELLNDTFMMEQYENLTITTDSYLENMMALHKMAMDENLSNLKRHEYNPSIDFIMKVNAYYFPHGNSINIPAGIIRDVFYEKDRPNYLNFGAIGYLLGHELTHGFDNEGRHYDKDGEKVNWWDKDSDEKFIKKAQCIIDQYDNYTTDIGLKVNGEKTQGENIADNGGLKEAYLAYNSWTKDNGIEPTLPGLNYTQNQLFWLSAAYTYCTKYKPEKLKLMLLTNEHSPGRYRVIGPMSNLEEFSKDFKCSADSPMNRKYKCKVW